MAFSAAQINAHLTAVLSNGRVDVGLEVGADPGLPAAQHVRLPVSMRVKYKAPDAAGKPATPLKAGAKSVVAGPSTATGDYKNWVFIFKGKVHEAHSNDGVRFTMGVENGGGDAPHPADWALDIRRFIAANRDAVRADEFAEDLVWKIHAVRYWAVKAGLVVTAKSREWVEVDDPAEADINAVSNEAVQFVASYMGQALTAAVARVASWRKTNHCTGGGANGIATGLPRRWMSKEGMWSADNDRIKAEKANQKFTTAFYIATHAVSTHAVLALIDPGNDHHFCAINASYGLLTSWDARESVRLRLTPPTQVAGAAMVADSVEVLKMLVTEGYSPLLTNANSIGRLVAAYSTVQANGMRVAVYSGWFFDGHPTPSLVGRIEFNQKHPDFSQLVGELAVVATKFYRGTTIGASPALGNAASQMATAADQTKWSQLARYKEGTASLAALKAFGRVAGAGASATLDELVSSDESAVKRAVEAYASSVTQHAGLLSLSNVAVPTFEKVMENAKTSDARADEVAKLGV